MNGIVVGLGIAFVVAGVFLVLYSVTYTESVFGVTLITRVDYPYQNFGYVVLLAGVLSLILGLLLSKKSEP